jgi:DNA-binding response OmpR family regulator
MPTDAARVLLIEDDTVLRNSVRDALRSAGFAVIAWPDGRDFATRVAAFRPDIAILDVMLPPTPGVTSGFALAKELRARSGTAIVFLTARDGVTDRLDGFEVGADDYIVKPFVLAELIARLRAVLRRTGKLTSGTLQVGDLLVDEDSGIVMRGAAEVAVTATELRLLVYLARNRDRVLSKTQILTQVWGYDDYDPNLVETFISGLRRKIERADQVKLIHTVRGIGYRMSVPTVPGVGPGGR